MRRTKRRIPLPYYSSRTYSSFAATWTTLWKATAACFEPVCLNRGRVTSSRCRLCAIRSQKKAHWDDFLAEDVNVWKAAKYLEPSKDTMDNMVPPLKRGNGSRTKDKAEQAEELLGMFFPPLLARIEDEGVRQQWKAMPMPDLTLEEIEEIVIAAKPWKAPGEDDLPAMVWRRLWPVVKYRVLALFDASLRDGIVPHQWRSAKIISLKKPNKGDYMVAKAWRPISLLLTPGKIMEAVVAERISYAVLTEYRTLTP